MTSDYRSPDYPPPGYRIVPLADQGVLIDCGETIDIEVNRWIDAAARAVRDAGIAGIVGIVPTYRSLALEYDSVVVTQAALIECLERLLAGLSVTPRPSRRWLVPVAYGDGFGADFEDFRRRHALARDELIALHTAPDYRVFMIGFLPGFAYLGGLDARLHTPRRDSPRTRTPAGSVSVGGQQTAVSSVEAPSGWHLLGRTPLRTFDPGREPPMFIEAGDIVRFVPVDAAEFTRLEAYRVWQPEWEWAE